MEEFSSFIIPGENPMTYCFLYYGGAGFFLEGWTEVLKQQGYKGSRVFYTHNFSEGFDIIKNHHIDGLLLDDSIGGSSKEWWLDNIDTFSDFKRPRCIRFMFIRPSSPEFFKKFSEFLQKNFPLH